VAGGGTRPRRSARCRGRRRLHKPTGWIAGEDIAAVAAKVLVEGPDVHAGKGYWMSTNVLNGAQAADILTDALGQTIPAEVFTP
jgi:hypothetical protein